MRYMWAQEDVTLASIKKELGEKALGISKGNLEVGKFKALGKFISVLKPAIEVEVEGELTQSELGKLDKKFASFNRLERE